MSIFTNVSDLFDTTSTFVEAGEGEEIFFGRGGFSVTTTHKTRREAADIRSTVVYDDNFTADKYAQDELGAMSTNPAFYRALTVKNQLKVARRLSCRWQWDPRRRGCRPHYRLADVAEGACRSPGRTRRPYRSTVISEHALRISRVTGLQLPDIPHRGR